MPEEAEVANGIMRNPDTLELLGFAPIFDSGNSMFYNVPYEGLKKVQITELKTHSFIEREIKLLQYVMDRSLVDLEKIEMDFSIYEQDIYEQRVRIPVIKELFQRKMELLDLFQNGRDIWKTRK
ncbi:hypothetical protein KE513_10785 [Oscillospiraceae bacterium Marseille-Q3528]|nr:hypothetical protein [Oscillospiraceae bacterium Marseille-Q3528]